MRISFTIDIDWGREPEVEPEETVQPDMSGVHIEVSGQVPASELAVRPVGFGHY